MVYRTRVVINNVIKIAKIEGVSEKAVRTAIRRSSEDNSFEEKPKNRPKKGPASHRLDKCTMKAFEQKKEASERDVAKKKLARRNQTFIAQKNG
jgi:DNA-binding transcriptional regulator PaaX